MLSPAMLVVGAALLVVVVARIGKPEAVLREDGDVARAVLRILFAAERERRGDVEKLQIRNRVGGRLRRDARELRLNRREAAGIDRRFVHARRVERSDLRAARLLEDRTKRRLDVLHRRAADTHDRFDASAPDRLAIRRRDP